MDYKGVLSNEGFEKSPDIVFKKVGLDIGLENEKVEIQEEIKNEEYNEVDVNSDKLRTLIYQEDIDLGLPNIHLVELTRQQGEIMKIIL